MNAHWSTRLVAVACIVAALLTAATAAAVGRVVWKKTTIEERDGGSWKIDLEIHLPRPPDTAHTPVRFSFKPVMYYEQTLVDGREDPILRKVPLHNKQPLVESVDIGFLDPGTGKLEKRTRFSFKVTRAHGFEAGEYQVTIKDGRSNATLGTTQRVVLAGENEVIDRRSMVFTSEKKSKKKEDSDEDDNGNGEQQRELTPDDDAFWEGGPDEEEERADGPPPVEGKPGGCGCRLQGSAPPSGGATTWVVGLLAGSLLARRRTARVRSRYPECSAT